MNMKKQYVKPAIEAVEVEYETLMTTTSGETGEAGTGNGTVGDEVDGLSNGRRGGWGNLWD